MKKRICTIVCLLIAGIIGIPIASSTASFFMNAAEIENSDQEKIIDFVQANDAMLYTRIDVAVVTESKRVYHSQNATASNSPLWKLMVGENGVPLEDVVKIALVSKNSSASEPYGRGLALRTDNTLYVWGMNNFGQFGIGTIDTTYTKPIMVDPGITEKIMSITATEKTYFILTENGNVYASGDNSNGQFGDGTNESSTTFKKLPINNVKKITRTEPNIIYALKNDGTIFTWGGTIYDGISKKSNVNTPTQIYTENKIDAFTNVVDIDADISQRDYPALAVLVQDRNITNGYIIGKKRNNTTTLGVHLVVSVDGLSDVGNVALYGNDLHILDTINFIGDGELYLKGQAATDYFDDSNKTVKIGGVNLYTIRLLENGRIFYGSSEDKEWVILVPLQLHALKNNDLPYKNGEKYNDNIKLSAISSSIETLTCKVEDPVGNAPRNCSEFINNNIEIIAQDQRVYRKYIIGNSIMNTSFVVDIYKGTPQLQSFTASSCNDIKITDTISLSVPDDQKDWNSYTATITDSLNQTSEFTGGTLNEGTYTIHVTDAYGNTQDFRFAVTDKPEPTVIFTPSSSNLVYNDEYTKVNGTVGTFSLQYPTGEPTSTIASIQLGTSGDESHFIIDTTGALKVKGNDLNAGTYNVTISGKDGNQMDFTKTVQIVVNKANQNNYQITNNANYTFQSNQEILITTTGNESGENETYTITNGNSIAQISNTNKFKMLSAGTFTLEATVAGNNNYNPKTVTKQITLSQLPAQTNPIKITSGDSMMYGNTYTPTSTGGTGSGAITWSIENDSGTGATLNNGSIKVTGVGSFTLKVTKAQDTNYQSSSDSKVITVNPRKTTVKPKDVTKKVGEVFKDNGVTYNPQPISGDNLGTPIITSKYPTSQQAGRYTDGIQVTGLTNPNYDFEYQEGTLIINDTTLPNNGSGYYKITGTLGKNNWYVSDIQIATTNKDGYDQISSDGINFQTTPITYHTDGEYPVTFYLKNSTTGIIAKGIQYKVRIDQTPPTVPTLTMNELNTSRMARLINFLSFGNWMNTGAEVIMSSTDATSGIDNYTYIETDTKGSTNTKTSTTGKVTYKDDVEIGITAKACDKAGNCSDLSASESLMIDRKGPEITGVKDQSVYKYYYLPRYIKVKDAGSGLSYAEYLKDGTQAGTIQEDSDERIDGVGKYEVNAIDNAGNESSLSFEIIPLPDIEDIDGSDESKDIIDQVKDEYEEVKDKLTDEEKKEYEDWIKDAEDKWESERKQVIETDDKSSKVEGQDGTTFDPNLELIVDDITDQPLPPLPKNANTVYDVYLQKGNTKVEPDGSIKVYLPYTDKEEPIIYQIDENGKVTEIKAEKEGSYVTFITDELGKFAISNTAQPDNKDNMCVVGPDGKVESGDEVCGKPNDEGDQPTKKPDGSVEVPDGGKVEFPNGTEIETPDGAIINPDGSVTLPDGTEYDPDGNIKDKNVCKLDGIKINIDTDNDGYPDINVDIDNDCVADLNIDMDNDQIPDVDIDSNGDGKPDINIDTDGDGKADINIAVISKWTPEKIITINGVTYDTMSGIEPKLNIDDDGDGKPDRNIDANGNGIIDSEENKNTGGALGSANTGDGSKWNLWWILMVITGITMIYAVHKKIRQKDTFQ